MSTTPDIVPFSETISQTAQEGVAVEGQVIAKSEMPESGHSGETSQAGEEGLGVDVRMSATPQVVQFDVQSDFETSQPVMSGSTSEMSLGAALDCDLKSEQMDGVHSKGQSSDAATQNPNGLDEILIAGTELEAVSEKKSVEVKPCEASKDSKWFGAIEKKNCKLLLDLFRSGRNLWVQTGLKGRSVLHVAVMQGCSELVRELYYCEGDFVFCGKKWQTAFEFLWENSRDGRLKDASAEDIWIVMEGPLVKSENCRSQDDYIESHVKCKMPVNSEVLRLREAISAVADNHFVVVENDVDFNFENVERTELYVHMACSRLRHVHNDEDWKRYGNKMGRFIIAVLKDLSQKNLLEKLFEQKDSQGRTVLQVFVLCKFWPDEKQTTVLKSMLEILPKACVNSVDTAGRTVLHWAVAHGSNWAVEVLLGSEKVERDITFETTYINSITTFHLYILYDEYLPEFSDQYLKDELVKDFCFLHDIYMTINYSQPLVRENLYTPLLWGMLMGRNIFVEKIMEIQAYKNHILPFAAYAGNVQILQRILQEDDGEKLNVISETFQTPPLHLAVQQATWKRRQHPREFDNWLYCNDFISIELLQEELRIQDERKVGGFSDITKLFSDITKLKYYRAKTNTNDYNANKACANLLLQAGADILLTDKEGYIADPGPMAPIELKNWWYELVAKETLNIKNDLNAAGTGTAVVATLVATASFVGPLQPPLNYVAMSSGIVTIDVGAQVTKLLIKVFLVSNSLSFYLAITSIMLAIMPSLPIPREGLVYGPCDDLKRGRRTISIAIGMLLASIISVLISFAASSLVVIPSQHRGLMAYSTTIGGLICCIGIFFFFLRFLRLICPRNTFIKKLYQKIGKL